MDLEKANNVEYEIYLKGLSEETVRKISSDLWESEWMLKKRLESLKIFYSLEMPSYWPHIYDLDFLPMLFHRIQ